MNAPAKKPDPRPRPTFPTVEHAIRQDEHDPGDQLGDGCDAGRATPNVLIFGEDVGYFGGVFRATEGLQKKFGLNRCFDAPITEAGLIGTAVGMGAYGLRPVRGDPVRRLHLPRLRPDRVGGGAVALPLGGGFLVPDDDPHPLRRRHLRAARPTARAPEALFTHIAGMKTVVPATPYDAKGLLIAAIEDDDPVIIFEPKRLYNGPFDGDPDTPVTPWQKIPGNEVPTGHYTVPLGKARIAREGAEVTVLSYGTMVHVAVASAEKAGIDAEVIDLRTLVPVDIETITASVKKTGRCVIVHEATRTSGFGAELSALVQEACFYHLEAPIERVTGWDTPYPHAFEWEYFPGQKRVGAALKRAMERQ